MLLRPGLLAALVLILAACGKAPDTTGKAPDAAGKTAESPDKPGTAKKGASPPAAPLLVAAEDVHVVANSAIASGPTITGSIQPERRADLRAEVASVVLQVMKENGDAVRKGDLLVRLDTTSIRDGLASAEAASRATAQAAEQAQRQLDRMKTLRGSGMTSAQALDDAETRRNNAQSEVEAARARAVAARQQMTRTEVRAPFDGVVVDRKVSAGDTAQVGKELVKVIDPASMRFEGLVSADQIGAVKAGQPVAFRVNGYEGKEFAGKVRRVNPAANPTTRQVEVLVDFTGPDAPRLAGLYAEGRVEAASATSLTVPATALVRDGDKTFAWVVSGSKLKKTAITPGDRDPRSGDFTVKAGLAQGDAVMRYPGALLADGQAVERAGALVPAATKTAGGESKGPANGGK